MYYKLTLPFSVYVNLRLCNGLQGGSQDFSKGGSQTGTPSGDRLLYMVYTAALLIIAA